MAIYFLETSALVKLYVRETGTEHMLAMAARSAENTLAILSLSRVEFRSAVRRRERAGEIPSTLASQLLGTFQRHCDTRFVIQAVADTTLDKAVALIDRYALRAFDAIQLAGCAAIKSDLPTFVCADKALLDAARQESIATFDPCA